MRRHDAKLIGRRHRDLRPQACRQRRALEQRLAHLCIGAETGEDSAQHASGKADLAIFRPSTGTWYILLSSTSYASFGAYNWGSASDLPVAA